MRVVVNVSLRIVWRPVLIIKQCIGDATVWLVHANDIAARRNVRSQFFEGSDGDRGGLVALPAFFPHRDSKRRCRFADLNSLGCSVRSSSPDLPVAHRRPENVSRRTFSLAYRLSVCFQIKIFEKQFAVVAEVIERRQQRVCS
jgi:hypothetical protein